MYDMAAHHGASDDRRFTDREMRLIFERAGEADVGAQGDRGYSLAEMQEIARQVGLSPTEIARAASTISSPQASYPMLGGPIRFHASHTLNGKLTEDGIASVALKIREATGFHGELREVPGGAEWRVRSATGLIVVDFTAKGAGTRIDLTVARDDEAAVTAIGVGACRLGDGNRGRDRGRGWIARGTSCRNRQSAQSQRSAAPGRAHACCGRARRAAGREKLTL